MKNVSAAQNAADALVHVRFLGSLQVRVHGFPVSFPTRHASLLFAYLAANPGVSRTRSHLGGLFWGDRGEEQARGSLRQTIFRVRRTLGPTETEIISADAHSVAVNASAVTSDIGDLEQVAAADPPGEFLAGWDGVSPELDSWMQSERTRINEALYGLLGTWATTAESNGEYHTLATFARRMMVMDPYDENAAQLLMKALAMTGNAAAAREAFHTFQERLSDELQISPSEETKELAAEISMRKGQFAGHTKAAKASTDLAPSQKTDAVRELRTVTVVSAWAQPRAGESTSNPEQVLRIRRRCEPAFDRVLKRYGGTADRAPGLISVSYFGWPIANEDAGRLAVDAAIAFQQITNCRIGISSGSMLIQPGLDPIGAPPDDAFELMSKAGHGEILISEATRGLIGGRYLLQNAGSGSARVLGPASLPERFSARVDVETSAMIGRDSEKELVIDRMRRADAGEGQIVIVTGDPGIGKSRLKEDVAREAAKLDARRILLQCRRMGQGAPFQPVLDHIMIASGVSRVFDTDAQSRRLHAHLEEAGIVDQTHLSAISDLLDLVEADEQSTSEQNEPDQKRATQFAALAAYFLSAQGGWLTFVVLEDAHWADPSTLELLEHLTARLGDSKLLLLITARPDFDASLFPGRFRTDLSLNSLGREETARLVRSHLPQDTIAIDIVDRIVELSDGVPLFIEQMTQWYAEHPDAFENAAGERPLTLKAVLETRLASLGEHRRVAQRAACIGRQFDRATLVDACARDPKEVDRAISEMLRNRLIFRYLGASGEEFSFTHMLFADTAYESLPQDDRRETHGLIFASLTASGLHPEAGCARQADLAGLHQDAMALYKEAGKRALAEFALQEATGHFEAALAQFPHLNFSEQNEDARVEIMGKLSNCSAHALGYNHPKTVDILGEAQRLAVSRPQAPAAIPILWQTYSLHYTQADGAKTCEVGRRVLSLNAWNEEFGPQQALGNRFLAGGHLLLGEFEAAEDAFVAATDALARIDAPSSVKSMGIDQLIPIGMLRARVLAILGRTSDALELIERTLDTADRLQLLQPTIAAHVLAAQTLLILHDFERANEMASISLKIAQKGQSEMWAAYSHCIIGIVKAREGQPKSALEMYQTGRETLAYSRTIVSTTLLDAVFAAELASLGLAEEASNRFSSTMGFIDNGGEPWSAPEAIRLDLASNSNTHRHDEPSFLQLKQSAEALATEQGARLWSSRLAQLKPSN